MRHSVGAGNILSICLGFVFAKVGIVGQAVVVLGILSPGADDHNILSGHYEVGLAPTGEGVVLQSGDTGNLHGNTGLIGLGYRNFGCVLGNFAYIRIADSKGADTANVRLVEVGIDGNFLLAVGVVQGGLAIGRSQNGIAGILAIQLCRHGVNLDLIGNGVGGDAIGDHGSKLGQIPLISELVVASGHTDHGNTGAHGIGDGGGVGLAGDNLACLALQVNGQSVGVAADNPGEGRSLQDTAVVIVVILHSDLRCGNALQNSGNIVVVNTVGFGAGIGAAVVDLLGGGVIYIAYPGCGLTVTEEDQTLVFYRNTCQSSCILQQVAAEDQTGFHVGAAVGQVGLTHVSTVAGGEGVDFADQVSAGGIIGNVHPILNGDCVGTEDSHGNHPLLTCCCIAGKHIQECCNRILQIFQAGLAFHISVVIAVCAFCFTTVLAGAAPVPLFELHAMDIAVSLLVAAVHGTTGAVLIVHGVGDIQHQNHRTVGGTGSLNRGVLGLDLQGDIKYIIYTGGLCRLGQMDLPVGGRTDGAVLLVVGVCVISHQRKLVTFCGGADDLEAVNQHDQSQQDCDNSLVDNLLCHYFVLLSIWGKQNIGSRASLAFQP